MKAAWKSYVAVGKFDIETVPPEVVTMVRSEEMQIKNLLLILALTSAVLPLAAQNYTPQKLVFTGAEAYKTADLIAVTGLTPGKPVTAPEIDVAMQHLVDTGLFSDMRYSVDGKALTFALTPVAADQFLAARYSNFAWWKPDELTPLVHARIPLFTGRVPVTGTMKDQVASALEALLIEKGVKAEVGSIKASEKIGGRVSRFDFSISQPIVKVGEVRIDQVPKPAAAKVEEIKERFSGQDYDVDQTGSALADNLRDVFLDLGYLDIATDPLSHGVPKVSANAITIDVATTIHEGAVYHVSQMVWPDSSIVPRAVLSASAQMKSGDLASKNKVLLAVALTERRFTAAGYIDAKMSVEPRKDETRHEVAYTFSVIPGEQYRLASVKTVGMTPEQQAEFDRNDKLVPGQAYNEDAVRALLVKLGPMALFQGHTFGISKYSDSKTHLVTVTISLLKFGSLPSR